jgi:hypothetical protein
VQPASPAGPRRRVAQVSRSAVAVAVAAVLLGTFMPWIRTGSRRRTSYGMMGLIDRLEFAPGGLAENAVRWWPLVPMLGVLTMIAAWWPRPRLAGLGGLVVAAYAGGVAVALRRAPVTLLIGRRVVVVAAAVLVVASLACLAIRPDRPTRPAGSTPA